ncbi:hypothetical protein [Streptomyces sp. NPDC058297]|uniref:hypothetical protein n=1 Tax=unclassified Streptomyces TaxID=2593676 RepID=UPI0036F07D93
MQRPDRGRTVVRDSGKRHEPEHRVPRRLGGELLMLEPAVAARAALAGDVAA